MIAGLRSATLELGLNMDELTIRLGIKLNMYFIDQYNLKTFGVEWFADFLGVVMSHVPDSIPGLEIQTFVV